LAAPKTFCELALSARGLRAIVGRSCSVSPLHSHLAIRAGPPALVLASHLVLAPQRKPRSVRYTVYFALPSLLVPSPCLQLSPPGLLPLPLPSLLQTLLHLLPVLRQRVQFLGYECAPPRPFLQLLFLLQKEGLVCPSQPSDSLPSPPDCSQRVNSTLPRLLRLVRRLAQASRQVSL
jgi:hypothetical protein